MEKNYTENGSSQSHSWWLENNRPFQSPWLQSTLSDLETRIKKMLDLIENDGDTFAKRAEMFYKKRPQLVESVEDLHRSYRALAEKYDQLMLKNESLRTLSDMAFPISNDCSKSPKHSSIRSHSNLVSDLESCDDHNSYLEFKKSPSKLNQQLEEENTGFMQFDNDLKKGCLEREKMWSRLRVNVSKLIEDNLEQKAELIRRNDEKREVINELRAHISKLLVEKRDMKTSLVHTKADTKRNRTQLSRMKDVFLKKLLP